MKSLYLVVLLASVTLCEASHSQVFPEDNHAAFKDVTAVDTRVMIRGWDKDAKKHPEIAKSVAQQAFDTAVMREGVRVSRSAPNYLICEIVATESGLEGGHFFTINVTFIDYNPVGLHQVLWRTWADGFDTFARPFQELGELCGQKFSYNWLRANTQSDTAD